MHNLVFERRRLVMWWIYKPYFGEEMPVLPFVLVEWDEDRGPYKNRNDLRAGLKGDGKNAIVAIYCDGYPQHFILPLPTSESDQVILLHRRNGG